MRYLIVVLYIGLCIDLSAQLTENFDDGSFPADPEWVGDVADFQVNADGELQLMALAAGSSAIYSAIDLTSDSTTITVDFKMDFNPSGSNFLQIYLALDDTDIATASGYYLQMGETGSEDAIRLYYLDQGSPMELATGSLGAVASDPEVTLRIDLFSGGILSLQADYDNSGVLAEEIFIVDQQFDLGTAAYFGLGMTYTAGRADLFFFDNISVNPFETDKEQPTVANAVVVDATDILVTYSEPVTEESASTLDNYSLNGSISPSEIMVNSLVEVRLTFADVFPADAPFTLRVADVEDLAGNAMTAPALFELNYAREALGGDVIINEILFDPQTGGEDYVELRNLTDDFLDLSGYIIGNSTRTTGATAVLREGSVVPPNGYLALTEDPAIVIEQYSPADETTIVEQGLPDFNASDGNVYLALPDGTIVESYDYDEDHHYTLISDTKGISLERISPVLPAAESSTWSSASRTVDFGTPGYKNSAAIREDIEVSTAVEFVEKTFSPDGDSDKDMMVLGYEFDKPGYIADVEIRDVGGFLIRKIISNESLSTTGLITWDGVDQEGKLANIGMYLVLGQFYHADGDVIPLKEVCVLAGRL